MGDRETYRLMCLYGELSGTTPTIIDGARIKHLRTLGYTPQTIEDGMRGVAAMLEGRLVMPEGALGWVGRVFTVGLLLFRDKTSGRRVVDLAGDAWRANQPRQDRTGLDRLTVGRIG